MSSEGKTEPVYKVLMFLKRRPGMPLDVFRDYYETTHAKLGEKYLTGVVRYVRRYVDPVGVDELPFDVITEVWLRDRTTAEAIVDNATSTPPPELLRDEEFLFDRSKSRVATVVEYDSLIAGASSSELLYGSRVES